jgi:hypothetical protein
MARFLGLQGAVLVPATATATTGARLATVIRARGIMCVHGRVVPGRDRLRLAPRRGLASGRLVKNTSPELARIREPSTSG